MVDFTSLVGEAISHWTPFPPPRLHTHSYFLLTWYEVQFTRKMHFASS